VSVTTDRPARLPRRGALPGRAGQAASLPPHRPARDDQTRRERWITVTRRAAVTAWALVVAYRSVTDGLAFNRQLLLLYIATGLIAASIGRGHKAFAVVRDWLPFALVLVLYDLSRGAATLLGAPTLWQFQPEADRWLFFGTVPTVWLQERIKMPQPPWWEVIFSGVYMSFFVLPYVIAGVLWLRNRSDWAAFARMFVALSFAAVFVYVVLPAAPPWAAARCTRADIVSGPSGPHCMYRGGAGPADGGLLGAMHSSQAGANQFVERISTRGWGTLHLQSAGVLIDSGQASVNQVAAIPSLHAALTAMISIFLWRRVRRGWRLLLVAYPLAMAFVLVYSAEHFVVDILLGWALAAIVSLAFGELDSSWSRRRATGRELAALEPAGDVVGRLAVESAVDPLGDVADVRRGDNGVQRTQRVVGRQRLGVEDVETGAGDALRPQCVDERRLVDDRTARGVDQQRCWPHERELVCADQPARALAEHQVDGQNVSATEQFVFGDVGRAGLVGGVRCQVCAPRDDVHAERLADACHARADPAQTQHTQHGTAQLQADRRLPATGAHRTTLVDDPAARGKDQRPCQFDGRLHVTAGRADVNAVVFGSRHVDRRIERPGRGDHLEPRQPFDHAPRQRRALAHHAHHIERRQSLDQVTLIGDVIVEHGDLGARSHL